MATKLLWLIDEHDPAPPSGSCLCPVRVARVQTSSPSPPGLGRVLEWDWSRALTNGLRARKVDVTTLAAIARIEADTTIVYSGSSAVILAAIHEAGHAAYWLTIENAGATDRRAFVATWLRTPVSIRIHMHATNNTASGMVSAARELRTHKSSPATTQLSLLLAAHDLLSDLTGDARGRATNDLSSPGRDATRARVADTGGGAGSNLRAAGRVVIRTLINRLSRRSSAVDQWTIGLLHSDTVFANENQIRIPPSNTFSFIDPGAERFVADPFLVKTPAGFLLFFEELHYADWRGVLKVVDVSPTGQIVGDAHVVLERPFHLSFPNVFRADDEPGRLFMLPEQFDSGRTVLYSCADTANGADIRFEDDVELLPELAGVDPVLFRHEGIWYLFVTRGTNGNAENNLLLFHSERLRGPFQPHPASPISLGLRGSRMAGQILVANGKIIRWGQQCATRYGAGVVAFVISRLSPTHYAERLLLEYLPAKGQRFGEGVHTLAYCENLLAIDAVRTVRPRNDGVQIG